MRTKLHNSSGFSILMAIGTIAVLLIIVTSLAITYIRESKLSRFSYDTVLSHAAAEGMFEYGMLKIRNHRDGFQDSVFSGETDGNILDLSTPRSAGLHAEYSIVASSTGTTFSLSGSEHLIIPLFTSSGSVPLGVTSLSPTYYTGIANTAGLSVSGTPNLSWTIVAMSGSENISITGIGEIDPSTSGTVRIKTSQCYSYQDGSEKPCSPLDPRDEELVYSYDQTMLVADFLSSKTDPYYIVYNSNPSDISVRVASLSPFSLPTTTLMTTAKKGDSSQVLEFVENKGKYYDALKYGIYNTP